MVEMAKPFHHRFTVLRMNENTAGYRTASRAAKRVGSFRRPKQRSIQTCFLIGEMNRFRLQNVIEPFFFVAQRVEVEVQGGRKLSLTKSPKLENPFSACAEIKVSRSTNLATSDL